MPNYRREYSGTEWFFTVVTSRRHHLFVDREARLCLREAVVECQDRYPFAIAGWILLPDHIHCIWRIENCDTDFSRRWSIIKRRFTEIFREQSHHQPPFWQKRFWEHCVRDEQDYENHLNYIHFNPVKHGYVASPKDWKWTSFHRYVEQGYYPPDWGCRVTIPPDVGNE